MAFNIPVPALTILRNFDGFLRPRNGITGLDQLVLLHDFLFLECSGKAVPPSGFSSTKRLGPPSRLGAEMKVTIVGSGDAFGTGGRAHTCIRVDSAVGTAVVDFGAGSIVSWQKLGLSFDDVDLIVISHLHGDHFGGLPFFLLDCQFVSRRTKPLLMIGPPGFKERLDTLLEAFFPGAMKFKWNFQWQAEEILARRVSKVAGMTVETFEVLHPSGGLATGVRICDGLRTFAFSGDTGWTENLVELSAAADLFLVECYSGDAPIPNHMDWPTLKSHVADFTAKQTVLTHLGETALPRIPEMEAAGLTIAYDGQTFDL